jgi:hypothetical protein
MGTSVYGAVSQSGYILSVSTHKELALSKRRGNGLRTVRNISIELSISAQETVGETLYWSATRHALSSRLILGFSGDEVRSRGRRLSPLLWQPCTSFPHARISVAVSANSAGGK